jgi:hypothetical protein
LAFAEDASNGLLLVQKIRQNGSCESALQAVSPKNLPVKRVCILPFAPSLPFPHASKYSPFRRDLLRNVGDNQGKPAYPWSKRCNRRRPQVRSRIPEHAARHFPPCGGTATAAGPPLQIGEQRNSAHARQHQPHPMPASCATRLHN